MLKRFLLCGLLLHALHAHLHLVTLSLPLSTSGGHLCMHPMHISQLLCTQVACIHTCIHNLSQECGLIVFMAQASKEYTLVPLCVSVYIVFVPVYVTFYIAAALAAGPPQAHYPHPLLCQVRSLVFTASGPADSHMHCYIHTYIPNSQMHCEAVHTYIHVQAPYTRRARFV